MQLWSLESLFVTRKWLGAIVSELVKNKLELNVGYEFYSV